jgi:hypothetical protein
MQSLYRNDKPSLRPVMMCFGTCTGDPVQSRVEATHLGCFALGIDSILGQRSQDRVQDDQCASRNGRYGAIVPPGLEKTTLSDSGGRIKGMAPGWQRVLLWIGAGSSDRFPNLQINNALTQSRATLGFFTCL